METHDKINALEAPYRLTRQPLPARWTPEQVARALVKAFRDPRPDAAFTRTARARRTLAAPCVEWDDQLAQAEIDDSERRDAQAASNRTNLAPDQPRNRADGGRLRLAARTCAPSIPAWRWSRPFGPCAPRAGARRRRCAATRNGRRTPSIANAPRRWPIWREWLNARCVPVF